MEIVEFNGAKLYKWKVGASNFVADPARGARLMNWFLELADGSVRDIVYWPDDADMGAGFAHVRGGNPILFPFCARSHADGVEGKWKAPDGRVLPMPQHGFARQGAFELLDVTDYAFVARFLPSDECRASYPYEYDFVVTYRFNEFSIACDLRLDNRGPSPVPWNPGHHFYFKMPWHDGASRRDYRIICDAKKAFRLDERGALVPVEASFPCDFSDGALWNRINCRLKTNIVKFGPKSGEEDITMTVGEFPRPEAGTSVVTWSESESSPFYCVEPWMGPPNCQEHKSGLHVVEPGASQTFSVQVSIF